VLRLLRSPAGLDFPPVKKHVPRAGRGRPVVPHQVHRERTIFGEIGLPAIGVLKRPRTVKNAKQQVCFSNLKGNAFVGGVDLGGKGNLFQLRQLPVCGMAADQLLHGKISIVGTVLILYIHDGSVFQASPAVYGT